MLPTTILAVLALLSPVPQGTKKKPVLQKPKPPVLGQVQMAGDNAKVGVTYSVGEKEAELNFTLESAEFALRMPVSDELLLADKDQKLLLLTFAVANPQKFDQSLNFNSFRLTVVSPDGGNSEYRGYLYHPERKTVFDSTLKPAQKVRVLVAMPIHARGPVDKLILKRGDAKVLRYDLRGKVKPLTGPFAESGDAASDKATVATKIPFDLGSWTWTVDEPTKLDEGLGENQPDAETDVWSVPVTMKNSTLMSSKVSWTTLSPKLTDENGEAAEWTQELLAVSTTRLIENVELAPGDQVRGRYVFRVAKGAKPKKLTLFDGNTERTVSVLLF